MMDKTLGFVSCKWMISALVIAILPGLSGCGKSEPPKVAEAKKQMAQTQPELERRQALMAVESVVSGLDSLQGGGGYQSWTAEKAVEKLVPLMNSANAPDPGAPKSFGPNFTYVADQATGPWQVVIKAEGETLQVAAYGSNASQPLEQRTIKVSQY